MQNNKSLEGYSSFFSSGFRGIYTEESRPRTSSTCSTLVDQKTLEELSSTLTLTPDPPEEPTRSKFDWTPPPSPTSVKKQRPRSLLFSSIGGTTSKNPESTITNTIISKLKKASSEAIPFLVLKDTRERLRPSLQRRRTCDESVQKILSSDLSTRSRSRPISLQLSPRSDEFPILRDTTPTIDIDPFSSCPSTKSIYIDIPIIPKTPTPPPPTAPVTPPRQRPSLRRSLSFHSKRGSFLSFGQSSPSEEVPRSISVISTSPSPLSSDRRNTAHLLPRNQSTTPENNLTSPNRLHRCGLVFSILPELEEEFESRPVVDSPLKEVDPASDLDWRQFHVELLQTPTGDPE
ncbi:hypothetical protein L218DRAFT_1077961 [Marasmius fiardii PR-910]|nr:hypothetical protein L218DRAFT_1077961 [Marasmius fiardii PR-910]